MITQKYLTELLLAVPNEDGTKRCGAFLERMLTVSLPNPESSDQTTELTRPSDLDSPTAFTQVLAEAYKDKKHVYNASHLPPRFPSKQPQHILKVTKNSIPKGPHEYFPVYVCTRYASDMQRQLRLSS